MNATRPLPTLATLGVLLIVTAAPGYGQQQDDKYDGIIVFVPSPMPVVDKMLDMAKVTKNDVVYSLGCGDGRFVAVAAKNFGARGVGVDIDPKRVEESLETVKKYQVQKLVAIRKGNALNVKDLDQATVVTLYMLPEFMERLEPIAKKQLKPGTRIVAHDYPFPNWKPDQTVEFKGPERMHTLYLFTVPKAKENK